MPVRHIFPIQTTWSPSQTVHIISPLPSIHTVHHICLNFIFLQTLLRISPSAHPPPVPSPPATWDRQPSSPDDEFYDPDKFIFGMRMIYPLTHGPVWQISREWTRGSRGPRGGVRGNLEEFGTSRTRPHLIDLHFGSTPRKINFPNEKPICEPKSDRVSEWRQFLATV